MSIRDDFEQGKEAEALLADLSDPIKSPSSWEEEFIDSITEQMERGRALSRKQMDVLRDIHERLC